MPQVEYLAARERWEAATKQLLTHETETAALISKVRACCYQSAQQCSYSVHTTCSHAASLACRYRSLSFECSVRRCIKRQLSLVPHCERMCSLAQCNIVVYLTRLLLLSYTLVCGTSGLQREQACDELMEASLQACQPPATDVRR